MGMIMHDDVPYGEGTSYTQGTGIAINNNIIAVDADNTPTAGSEKPVKSKGVSSAVKQIYADNGVLGAKNLFRNPYYDGASKISNGVTFTVNNDGSITVDTNGVASTGEASFRLIRYDRDQDIINTFNEKTLKKSGTDGDVYVQGYWSGATHREDEFTVDTANMNNWNFAVYVGSGKIVNNVTIYPMLRLASDPDDTYVPYAMTNRELTEELTVKESAVTDIVEGANAVNNKLYKTGHVVSCNIVLLNVNVSGGGIIFKIPNGYIPTTAFYALNISNVTGDNVEIKTNGVINAQHDITDGIIVLSTTWITN